MKSLILGMCLAISANASSFAAPEKWELSKVTDEDTHATIGHIYHTETLGKFTRNKKTDFSNASLRFICSNTKNESVILVYMNALDYSGVLEHDKDINFNVAIDNHATASYKGKLVSHSIYRLTNNTDDLYKSLTENKKSYAVISWAFNDTKYSATFTLKDINSKLSQYQQSCKTN